MSLTYESISEFLSSFGVRQMDTLAEVARGSTSFFLSPGGSELLLLKLFFGVLSLLMLGGIIFFVTHTNYMQFRFFQDATELFTYKSYGSKRLRKIWNKILKRLDVPDEAEYKLAVIEADDTFNDILARMGHTEGGLGERLSRIAFITPPTLREIQEAHDIRNSIVHDPDYHITLDQARKTLDIYERALRDMQALE